MRLLPMLLALLLGACSTLPTDKPVVVPVAERQAQISSIPQWQAVGRIALSTRKEAYSTELDWRQDNDKYTLTLTAPLGQRVLHVVQTPEQATVQSRGNPQATGRSAEALVFSQLGARVPLSQMRYWLRGLPGDQGEAKFDTFGRMVQLAFVDYEGRRWRARIDTFTPVDNIDLPRVIKVTDGEYDIRVVVTGWVNGGQPRAEPAETPSSETGKKPGRLQIPGAET